MRACRLPFSRLFSQPCASTTSSLSRHTLDVTRSELPYYFVFILFASLLTWFTAIRRRVERELLQSRDELAREVAVRTQQAGLLDLTHDSIFVRDMEDVI